MEGGGYLRCRFLGDSSLLDESEDIKTFLRRRERVTVFPKFVKPVHFSGDALILEGLEISITSGLGSATVRGLRFRAARKSCS